MVEIPPNRITLEDIRQWHEAKIELARAQAREILLRKSIFEGIFTDLQEGTERFKLDDVTDLVGVGKLNRKVDAPALRAAWSDLGRAIGSKLDMVINWVPELKIGAYKKLTDEERDLIDTYITTKPGTPELRIEAKQAKE